MKIVKITHLSQFNRENIVRESTEHHLLRIEVLDWFKNRKENKEGVFGFDQRYYWHDQSAKLPYSFYLTLHEDDQFSLVEELCYNNKNKLSLFYTLQEKQTKSDFLLAYLEDRYQKAIIHALPSSYDLLTIFD